jgi:exodeoxyribonuclease V alpha subunit
MKQFNFKEFNNGNGILDETVNGQITTIRYHDPTSNFKIFDVLDEKGRIVKCKGEAPAARIGLDIRCTGYYTNHHRYGMQFEIDTFQIILPTSSLGGLQGFLGSGMIEGLGFILAYEICNHFKTVEMVKQALHNPDLLTQVKGIGEKSAQIISASYISMEHIEHFLARCFDYGLDIKTAIKIYERHKDDALAILQGDPYSLLKISGVSWDTIDILAQEKLGFTEDHPSRISAAVGIGLQKGTRQEGHTFMYDWQLVDHVYPLLKRVPSPDDVRVAAEQNIISTADVSDNAGGIITTFYPRSLYIAENETAKTLVSMMLSSTPLNNATQLISQDALILDEVQKKAVINSLKNRVNIVTGGPGTGKTLLARTVLREMRLRGVINPLLCAPTGRAAKQMEKSTHYRASTIHRALGYDGENFRHDAYDPIPHRTVIMDEASMADINLFYHLLDALPVDSRLLMIGDVDQLPSVGPGNVLADIIDSNTVPYVRLRKIYRQGAGSNIPILSKAVNEYEDGDPLPDLPYLEDGADVGFIAADAQSIGGIIRELVTNRLPKMGFGEDDIQVLSPRRTGPGSVGELNKVLRAALNPGDPRNDFGRFRIRDKVMQITNVYEIAPGIDVMNGDMGRVVKFGENEKYIVIDIEDVAKVNYEVGDLKHVTHAYCITVHKSQGGQYPCVVLALLPEHGRLLYRSLLYTAITRAEHKLVIVGDKAAFAKAVRTTVSNKRQTLLMERLQDKLDEIATRGFEI